MGKAVFWIRISHESRSKSVEQIKVYLCIHAPVSLLLGPDLLPGELNRNNWEEKKWAHGTYLAILYLKKNSYLREVPLAVLSKEVVGQEESAQGEEEQKAEVEEPEKENKFF